MAFPVMGLALAMLAAVTLAPAPGTKGGAAARPTAVLTGHETLVPFTRKSSVHAIAERYAASPETLRRLNGLGTGKKRSKASMLFVSTRSIAPRPFPDGIVINIPAFRLFLLRKGEVVRSWPVALGRDFDRDRKNQKRWRTPLGTFKIRAKYWHPDWIVPKDLQKELKNPREIVPYGDPEYPLGEAKLQLTSSGLTIHGTNSPRSIGKLASHGCIRMWNSAIKDLYKEVKAGTPVALVYVPVQVVEDGGRVWLEVNRDVYGLAGNLLERTRTVLAGSGLLDLADPDIVARTVAAAPGVAIDVTATRPEPALPDEPVFEAESPASTSPRVAPISQPASGQQSRLLEAPAP